MENTLSGIIGSILNFSEQYHQLRNQQNNNSHYQSQYKIGNTYEYFLATKKILLQLISGSAYAHYSAEEIFNNIEMMAKLHPIDARTISYLYLNDNTSFEQHSRSYMIIKEHSDSNIDSTYVLENINTGEILTFSEKELANSPEICSKFCIDDAIKISFQHGAQHQKKH